MQYLLKHVVYYAIVASMWPTAGAHWMRRPGSVVRALSIGLLDKDWVGEGLTAKALSTARGGSTHIHV